MCVCECVFGKKPVHSCTHINRKRKQQEKRNKRKSALSNMEEKKTLQDDKNKTGNNKTRIVHGISTDSYTQLVYCSWVCARTHTHTRANVCGGRSWGTEMKSKPIAPQLISADKLLFNMSAADVSLTTII